MSVLGILCASMATVLMDSRPEQETAQTEPVQNTQKGGKVVLEFWYLFGIREFICVSV
jgi:hypothetical protein